MADDLQQTRYDQLLRRVGGIIGPGSKVSAVIPELFPMLDVENVPPELLILSGTNVCFGAAILGAVAAQNSKAQLSNPAGSGKIVTVDTMYLTGTVGTRMMWGRSQTLLTGIADTQVFADTRNPILALPTSRIRTETSVGTGPGNGLIRFPSQNTVTVEPPHGVIILAPGENLTVTNIAVNQGFEFTFYWRERVGLTSELDL